jgi:hypothetical protein
MPLHSELEHCAGSFAFGSCDFRIEPAVRTPNLLCAPPPAFMIRSQTSLLVLAKAPPTRMTSPLAARLQKKESVYSPAKSTYLPISVPNIFMLSYSKCKLLLFRLMDIFVIPYLADPNREVFRVF